MSVAFWSAPLLMLLEHSDRVKSNTNRITLHNIITRFKHEAEICKYCFGWDSFGCQGNQRKDVHILVPVTKSHCQSLWRYMTAVNPSTDNGYRVKPRRNYCILWFLRQLLYGLLYICAAIIPTQSQCSDSVCLQIWCPVRAPHTNDDCTQGHSQTGLNS